MFVIILIDVFIFRFVCNIVPSEITTNTTIWEEDGMLILLDAKLFFITIHKTLFSFISICTTFIFMTETLVEDRNKKKDVLNKLNGKLILFVYLLLITNNTNKSYFIFLVLKQNQLKYHPLNKNLLCLQK